MIGWFAGGHLNHSTVIRLGMVRYTAVMLYNILAVEQVGLAAVALVHSTRFADKEVTLVLDYGCRLLRCDLCATATPAISCTWLPSAGFWRCN